MAFRIGLPKSALLVGLMLVLSVDVICGWPITGTPGVGIQDKTGGPMFVHCQSKDTNFSPRTMQNNDVWSWSFKPDFGGSTLYWCIFNWNGNTQNFIVWDIDTAPIYDRSINDWRVEPSGFWLYDPVKAVWNQFHDWIPPSAADQGSADFAMDSTITNVTGNANNRV